jgi:hypothetical protein
MPIDKETRRHVADEGREGGRFSEHLNGLSDTPLTLS